MKNFIHIIAATIIILFLLCFMQYNAQNCPVTDLYIEPTPITVLADKLPQASEIKRTLSVTAYGYCPCNKCCSKSNGITATGVKAREGRTVAVDAELIPLGSTIIIDGHEYVAEDVGGGIKGNKVDVYFDSHKSALKFGKRIIEIEVRE